MTQTAASVLDRNFAALLKGGTVGRDIVERLSRTAPTDALRFDDTADGVPSGSVTTAGHVRQLCSRRRPLDEARELINPVDLRSSGVFVVAGFGMGYHVAELARKLGPRGLIVVYEPQLELLRAVLERVDHSAWLAASSVRFISEASDAATMTEALSGNEGMVGIGVELIQHPPSAARLGDSTSVFFKNFTSVVEAVKMTVVTTLGQSRVTIRNLLQNVDVYSGGRGVAWLANLCAGKPAIVVAAGPSLQRNIDLLTEPGIGDRCVIIAVQTVLKTLLAKGIKPHFVTALDYSEINRRFYEGLTREQVEGITLVVEPKVNPAVVMAWPGEILCTADMTLDLLLGPELAGENAALRAGATVAHLAYYLARHLGCDPVALVGQDLGFTDGQYYASGAAIHNVWSGELNEFKTLEMLEWQRIARMGEHLRPATDHLGRRMYTDVQMLSYLRQFEQDFRADAHAGKRVVDCTEGGVRKQHTDVSTLRDFLSGIGHAQQQPLAARLRAAERTGETISARQSRKLRDRVSEVRRQVGRIGDLSRKTAVLLSELIEHHDDQQRVNRLIGSIEKHRDEIDKLKPGFALVNLLGQTAIFNRIRADRHISFEDDADPYARQRLRAERDVENVRTLAKAADDLGAMLDDCARTLDGAPRITRDMRKSEIVQSSGAAGPAVISGPATVTAVIHVDPERSSLGWARDLGAPIAGRPSRLALTLERLLASKRVGSVALCGAPDHTIRRLVSADVLNGGRVLILPDVRTNIARARAIAAGRLWARACWRGGLSDLTCYDEVFDPAATAAVMHRTGADGALIVGADWCALDPALCDAVVARHDEDRVHYRATFTNGVPGVCGMFISRTVCEELAPGASVSGLFSSIGGLVGYLPVAPALDVVGQPICLGLEGAERDCGLRLIADTPLAAQVIESALAANVSSGRQMCEFALATVRTGPTDAQTDELSVLSVSAAAVRSAAAHITTRPWSVVTIGDGRVSPLCAPECADLLAVAKASAGVHVRMPASAMDQRALDMLKNAGVLIISVDVDATHWKRDLDTLQALRAGIGRPEAMGVPWIVPRLVRQDSTYDSIEAFVNTAIMGFGSCTLDAHNEAGAQQRIRPLPLPTAAQERFARSRRSFGVAKSFAEKPA